MAIITAFLLGYVLLLRGASAVNFGYEAIQLRDIDIGNFSAIAFGDKAKANPSGGQGCKVFPGTDGWPSASEWSQLNASMNGHLLMPNPYGAACYPGALYDDAKCTFVVRSAGETRFFADDPLSIYTLWPEGNSCPATLHPTQNCTQGGFPTYVVNVTTVKDMQVAINFARNMNIRLTIKNTGHEWVGRSTGAGSISLWTHFLKDFELLSNFTINNYTGAAARVGVGLEAWEVYNLMVQYNVTFICPPLNTVGAFGGYTLGGGHSSFTSKWGLSSDQVLSLEVVTADGRLVTADPTNNTDLYYALRGGGPSTFGVVSSMIVKAYPAINLATASLTWGTGPNVSTETFWDATNAYFAYGKAIVDAGGIDRNNVFLSSYVALTFATTIEMPGMTADQMNAFLQPLIDSLAAVGIADPVTAVASGPYATTQTGVGFWPYNSRFTSRLYPRAVWDDQDAFGAAMAATRRMVEAGYFFHGLFMSPKVEVAGWPGVDSGLNPAWRSTIMHADIFDYPSGPMTAPADELQKNHARMENYMEAIRNATPGGGAYINEADVEEPNWQQAFFGANYNKLLGIKNAWDPWGLFWAPATVGSEPWQVQTADGLPTQNGKLCMTS